MLDPFPTGGQIPEPATEAHAALWSYRREIKFRQEAVDSMRQKFDRWLKLCR